MGADRLYAAEWGSDPPSGGYTGAAEEDSGRPFLVPEGSEPGLIVEKTNEDTVVLRGPAVPLLWPLLMEAATRPPGGGPYGAEADSLVAQVLIGAAGGVQIVDPPGGL